MQACSTQHKKRINSMENIDQAQRLFVLKCLFITG